MTTFLVIGAIGLVLLLVSLVIGDLFDGLEIGSDVFSSAVIGGFVAAFGFAGAIGDGASLPLLLSLGIGTVAGVGAGWFAWWLTRLVKDGGSDATVSIDDTLGRDGRVLSHIPDGGFGTVRILVGGHTLQLNARAAEPIEAGTEVHVTSVLSPTAVTVARVWGELPT